MNDNKFTTPNFFTTFSKNFLNFFSFFDTQILLFSCTFNHLQIEFRRDFFDEFTKCSHYELLLYKQTMTFVCIISILLGELRHQRKNTQCKACHGTYSLECFNEVVTFILGSFELILSIHGFRFKVVFLRVTFSLQFF